MYNKAEVDLVFFNQTCKQMMTLPAMPCGMSSQKEWCNRRIIFAVCKERLMEYLGCPPLQRHSQPFSTPHSVTGPSKLSLPRTCQTSPGMCQRLFVNLSSARAFHVPNTRSAPDGSVRGWPCRKALAEFRRTHEEAALAEAKRALQPDQWDALQSVASPASYFA